MRAGKTAVPVSSAMAVLLLALPVRGSSVTILSDNAPVTVTTASLAIPAMHLRGCTLNARWRWAVLDQLGAIGTIRTRSPEMPSLESVRCPGWPVPISMVPSKRENMTAVPSFSNVTSLQVITVPPVGVHTE